MNFSKYGDLCQSFIIEAIRYYSKMVSESTPKDNPNAIINPIIWHGIATDIYSRLAEQYNIKKD
jgi:hypothetical protein